MRIESSYPAPVHGVSTLAPRNRAKGQAGKQTNFRSDPVNKLTRRPSMQWAKFLLTIDPSLASEDILHHSYERNGDTIRLILNKTTGYIWVFSNNILIHSQQLTTNNWVGYVGRNMVAQTIGEDTYFVNTDKIVLMDSTTDASVIEKVSHVNVTTALNYGETVQVNITKSNGTRSTISYTIPDLGTTEPDYDTADKARATKQVALELAARINGGGTHQFDLPNPDYAPTAARCYDEYIYTDEGGGNYSRAVNLGYNPTDTICKPYIDAYTGVSGVTAVALGSSIAIWEDGKANWLDVEIETGQGERSCVAINRKVERITGLPLYAVVGTRITIQPDPTTEKGVYYLQAERTGEATGEVLEEVVWTESRSPEEPYAFDVETMPHVVSVQRQSNGTYIVTSTTEFKDRRTGDNESSEVSEFVNNTIKNIGYFQKRLVLLSENNTLMSETDDLTNFWKQSAVQLLVSDPVSVASSAVGIDVLTHITPHNRDLLITTTNGQFKIDGTVGITPQTISMPLTTAYECQTSVAPVALGNAVFLPVNYGTSTGIQEYTSEKNTTQDQALQLTQHVVGYMPGVAKIMVASSNLEMIALVTSEGGDNKLFIYDQYTSIEGKKLQRSWSEWILPTSTEILDMEFTHDKLSLIVRDSTTKLVVKEIDMYSRTATGSAEVFLDDLVKLDTDGLTVTLPDNYNATDMIVVQGDDTDYELNLIGFTKVGSTLTLDEDIGVGKVYIGKTFESRYQPTRPFKYDDNNIAVTTDRLRLAKFILNLVDTNEIRMHIVSDYYETEDQVFNSRYIGGIQNLIGKVPFHTGDFKFSFAQDAELALAEFYCNNHLGCTIAALSWEGQYYKSKGRM